VTILAASQAPRDVLGDAVTRLMAHRITLEAQLGVAVETFVAFRAAQYAIEAALLVGTLARHMPELMAAATLYRRVRLQVVSAALLLQLGEHVDAHVLLLLLLRLCGFTFFFHVNVVFLVFIGRGFLLALQVDQAAQISVAFDGAARDQQVGVALLPTRHRRDVVVGLVAHRRRGRSCRLNAIRLHRTARVCRVCR